MAFQTLSSSLQVSSFILFKTTNNQQVNKTSHFTDPLFDVRFMAITIIVFVIYERMLFKLIFSIEIALGKYVQDLE